MDHQRINNAFKQFDEPNRKFPTSDECDELNVRVQGRLDPSHTGLCSGEPGIFKFRREITRSLLGPGLSSRTENGSDGLVVVFPGGRSTCIISSHATANRCLTVCTLTVNDGSQGFL